MANPEFFPDHEHKEPSSQKYRKESPSPNINFILVKQKADLGDAEAQFDTGVYYEEGKGTKQSDEKAFHYYKLAADQGQPIAQFKVGDCYAEGKGVRQSFEEAVSYYQMAADQDLPSAWQALAAAYEKGNGVERSHEKADFYNQKWFHYFKARADQGDSEAQATTGFLFENGIGVDRSLDSAFHYYDLSAKQGFARGLCCLAECYARGKGVNQSVDQAIHLYQLAIKEDSTLAMYGLATLLYVNKLQETDAIHYFQTILQRKSEFSPDIFQAVHYWLGHAYESGRGIKKSVQKALDHFRMSADLRNLLAQKKLADAYLNGDLGVKKDVKKALHYYQQAANQRDPSSIVFLGRCYETGMGVEQSFEHAFQFYQLASDIDIKEGSFSGIFECARCYEKGIGIEKSLETAIRYYKLSAENGHPKGYFHVATCYQKIGGEEAEKNAAHYFKMGSSHVSIQTDKEAQRIKKDHRIESKAKGNPTVASIFSQFCSQKNLASLIRIGKELQKQGKDQEAFEYLKKAADQGDSITQNNVGYYYEIGKGVEKDLTQAFHYYELAAIQNSKQAICNLAICYQEGRGVDKSAEKAFNLFKKAADQKFARGQYHVANCYQWGIGVEISLNKAIEYYRLALAQKYEIDSTTSGIADCEEKLNILKKLQSTADKGDALSQYELGRAYYWGKLGLKKDEAKAVYYYTLAAEQECLKACQELFHCYYEGIGVEKSFEKALQYIRILVDHNQPEFLDYLGKFFEKGYGGLKQSYQEAFNYYKQAADQGYAHSQLVIGEYFKKGLGTESSAEDAFKYTKLAADERIPKAQYELGEMYRLGIGVLPSDPHALDYYLRAANRGFLPAQEALSDYYHFGSQIDQPYEETLDHVRTLAFSGNSSLQYEVGNAFSEGKNGLNQSDENAFIYYQLAADQGHAEAQFIVGDALRKGKVVQQSHKLAREYFKKAAMQGNYDAWRDLARYYQYGIDSERPYEETLTYIGNLAIKASSLYFLDDLAGDFEIGRNGLKQSYEEAFKYFKMAAEKEYTPSQFAVGLYYKNGWGVEQSDANAFKYFTLAVKNNRTLYYLGEAYRMGKGVEQSDEKACEYYRITARKGSVEACAALAQHYGYLFTKEQDYQFDANDAAFFKEKESYDAILKYLETLAPKGSSIFQHNLAVYFEKGINGLQQSYQEAFKYFKMAAEKGYAPSQRALGIYFKNGQGVEQSYEKAFKYFKLAADQGDHIAQSQVADCYRLGRGVEKSRENAFTYYHLGADQGNSHCIRCLRVYYKEKLAGTKNSNSNLKTLEKYRNGTDKGDADAQYNLGLAYFYGRFGLEKDIDNGLHYFTLAADQGNIKASKALFDYYYHEGQHHSYEKALKFLRTLAAEGKPSFLYQLGIYHAKGLGALEQSYEEAFKLFKIAAEKGYKPAILELSDYYQYGRYVKESYSEAARYLKMGAQVNDPECLFRLAHYYENGWGDLNPSFFDALNCYRSAALWGHKGAREKLASFRQIFNLNAERVKLINQDPSTLKAIFQNNANKPIFLEGKDLNSEKIQIIRDAMIENPKFTFVCSEQLIERLFIAFEAIGYQRNKDLRYGFLIPKLMGCIFIGEKPNHQEVA